MRVGIVGSRDCGSHLRRTQEILAVLRAYGPGTVVVSGDCPTGIDMIAKRCAKALGLEYVGHPADWKRLGKRAGFARNGTIVADTDEGHAWWNGISRGTMDTVEKYKKAGKLVIVHRWEPK